MQDEILGWAEALGIHERVHLLGETSTVERLLNAIDVFLLNSHREGMSNTVLEAMACETPVVATRVGDNDELLDEGSAGLLVPPDDSEAVANAIDRLAQSPRLRGELGRQARNRVAQQYSISAMVEAYSALYLQMAESLGRFGGRMESPSPAAEPQRPWNDGEARRRRGSSFHESRL